MYRLGRELSRVASAPISSQGKSRPTLPALMVDGMSGRFASAMSAARRPAVCEDGIPDPDAWRALSEWNQLDGVDRVD